MWREGKDLAPRSKYRSDQRGKAVLTWKKDYFRKRLGVKATMMDEHRSSDTSQDEVILERKGKDKKKLESQDAFAAGEETDTGGFRRNVRGGWGILRTRKRSYPGLKREKGEDFKRKNGEGGVGENDNLALVSNSAERGGGWGVRVRFWLAPVRGTEFVSPHLQEQDFTGGEKKKGPKRRGEKVYESFQLRVTTQSTMPFFARLCENQEIKYQRLGRIPNQSSTHTWGGN